MSLKTVSNADPGDSDHVGGDDWDYTIAAFKAVLKRFTSVVYKSGSTYYARKYDGSQISSSGTFETVLAAACALKGSVLITGHDTVAPDTMTFSGSFAGIDLVADTTVIIDKSCNLTVPQGYTGYVFRDHDQGYLSIVMYGQVNEAGTPARLWTFLKLQSDGSSGCINTLLSGYGGQINNAGLGVELNCTSPGFINGNTFENLFIDGTVISFKFVGSSSAPIHHNTFSNITIEGESGGAVRTGFKDICGERNVFFKCDTNDYAATDFSFNFTSSSRGNHVENCSLDQGTFTDLGFQNSITNVRTGGDTTSGILTSYYTRPDLAKTGMFHGGSNAQECDGFLNSRISATTLNTGTKSNSADSTGMYMTMDTGATINSIFGHRLTFAPLTRINHAYFKTALYPGQTTASRIFAGFSTNTGAAASTADPLNAQSGVGLWFDSAVSANWKRMHNSGSGASTVDDTSLALAANTLYPVEIYAVDDNRFRFVFNGVTTDISTAIPASTTNLGFQIYIENTAAASKTCRVYYYILRTDK